MRRPTRGDLGAGLVLAALALGSFSRLVAQPGGLIVDAERPSVDRAQREDFRVAGNDLTGVFLPHYGHVAREVARLGKLPQWDDSGFAGRPMIGNPQGGLFYPPAWLTWVRRSPEVLGWLTVAHLLWAALGTYVLARGAGVGRPGATVSAGCVLASPYLLAHTFEGHYPHVWAACWYPWAFAAYRRMRTGGGPGRLALPAILALTLLTGHPQEWYYLTFALGVWVLADALRLARGGEPGAGAVSLAAWSGVVGLALGMAAVELAPELSAQAWTLRGSRLPLDKVTRYQLHGLNLFQLLSPTALGGPADYFGHDNYWETVLSIGLVPLVLAGVAAACHPDRRLVRGWLLLVVATVVFAAGPKLGLFSVLFRLVPGMDRFRVAARSLFLANLGAAVLAGLGVDALARLGRLPAAWDAVARRVRHAAVAVVAGLLLLRPFASLPDPRPFPGPPRPMSQRDLRGLLRSLPDPPFRAPLAATRVLGDGRFWLALAGVLVVLEAGRSSAAPRSSLAAALGLLALVELGLYGRDLLRVSPPDRFLGDDPISRVLAASGTPDSGRWRIRARDTLYPDLRAWSNGVEKVNINDSFQVQHAADLYEPLYALLYLIPPPDPADPMGEAVARHRHEVRQAILDRLAVAYLVSDHVEPAWPLVASGRWQGATYAVHRNPTAMPRAYVVPRAEPISDGIPAMRARLRVVDPRDAVLMPRDPLPPGGPRQPFTPARWTSADPDRVVLRATTEAPGLLVVADTWMPGWTATVDGRPAPILRGNHAQRVIPLPQAGPHEVVLSYRAPGFARGLALTTSSVGLWLVAGIATTLATARRARRPRLEGPAPHLRAAQATGRASRAGSSRPGPTPRDRGSRARFHIES